MPVISYKFRSFSYKLIPIELYDGKDFDQNQICMFYSPAGVVWNRQLGHRDPCGFVWVTALGQQPASLFTRVYESVMMIHHAWERI